MERTHGSDRSTQRRKMFYDEVADLARRNPAMKVSLYLSRDDLSLLAREDFFSTACDLLDLCSAGQLTLKETTPVPPLLKYLQGVRHGERSPQRESLEGEGS